MNRKSSKKATTSRSDYAWDALQQLIDLAAAAQIPLIGGGFDVASKVLTILKDARATQSKCRDLLDVVSEYTTAIWKFVELVSVDRLKEARDRESAFARQAVEEFGQALDKVIATIQGVKGKNFVTRVATNSSVNRELAECKDELARASESFKRAQQTITVAHTFQLRDAVDEGISRLVTQDDPYRILGVKALRHDSIIIRGHPKYWKSLQGFWEDVYEADLDHRPTLVKVYKDAKGGKRAFEKDLFWLSDNFTMWTPRARAYCWNSHAPFIVLDTARVDPLEDWLRDEVARLPESNIQAINQFLDDLELRFESAVEALNFLLTTDMAAAKGTTLSVVVDTQHPSGRPRLMYVPAEDSNGGEGLTNANFEKQVERFCLIRGRPELSPWELSLLDEDPEDKIPYVPIFKVSLSILMALSNKVEAWTELKCRNDWLSSTLITLDPDHALLGTQEYIEDRDYEGFCLTLSSEKVEVQPVFNLGHSITIPTSLSLPPKAAIYGMATPGELDTSKVALVRLKPSSFSVPAKDRRLPAMTTYSTSGCRTTTLAGKASRRTRQLTQNRDF